MHAKFMNNQCTTSTCSPSCVYAKSPTVQNAFQPIPGLSSCTWATKRQEHC